MDRTLDSRRLAYLSIAMVALLSVWPRAASADPCKVDGQACRRNNSCCGGVCGKNGCTFGTCCTPTTCAAGACGIISNGCGGSLDCGLCTTTTTTTSTTSSTTVTSTTLPSCESSDTGCRTPCSRDGDCPSTRACYLGFCEPKVEDHRACLVHDDCLSGCCCGVGVSTCGPTRGICRQLADCEGGFLGSECPGSPCGQDSDCRTDTQFCTGGVCTPKGDNGDACAFSAGCFSDCCCSTGVCTTEASCTGGGRSCNP